jgi:hypothetical protein
MPIELSLHRISAGELQPLDEPPHLEDYSFARVEDEGILSLQTPDGGSAWVSGAGPGESGGMTVVEFSIDVLSEQLVQVLHSYAERSGMVIARLPVAVYITTPEQARHLPAEWPAPAVCTTPERLLELLRES